MSTAVWAAVRVGTGSSGANALTRPRLDLRVDGAADSAAAASDRSWIRPMRKADGAAVKGGAGSSGANALTRRESFLLLKLASSFWEENVGESKIERKIEPNDANTEAQGEQTLLSELVAFVVRDDFI